LFEIIARLDMSLESGDDWLSHVAEIGSVLAAQFSARRQTNQAGANGQSKHGGLQPEATQRHSIVTTRSHCWPTNAVATGARINIGGERIDNTPTVLSNVTPAMRIQREDVFGPVVKVTESDDFDAAPDIADDFRCRCLHQ
jgi:acyl-CoA reductase-like NAD-dependent aldehyde dehydrogenase